MLQIEMPGARNCLSVTALRDLLLAVEHLEVLVYQFFIPQAAFGLFALEAKYATHGALAVAGASIVDARIHTLTNGMALDTFWIQDAAGGTFDRPDRLARLSVLI